MPATIRQPMQIAVTVAHVRCIVVLQSPWAADSLRPHSVDAVPLLTVDPVTGLPVRRCSDKMNKRNQGCH